MSAERPVDIIGGGYTDPGDTELDDAIEQIVADYIPDSLLRVQLAKRILAEVLRRTPIDDPYARPRPAVGGGEPGRVDPARGGGSGG